MCRNRMPRENGNGRILIEPGFLQQICNEFRHGTAAFHGFFQDPVVFGNRIAAEFQERWNIFDDPVRRVERMTRKNFLYWQLFHGIERVKILFAALIECNSGTGSAASLKRISGKEDPRLFIQKADRIGIVTRGME